MVREETYEKSIAYKTVTKQSAKLFEGQQKVTGGTTGKKKVTAKVCLINGEEVSREVTKETVTKKAVTKVITKRHQKDFVHSQPKQGDADMAGADLL